MIVYLENRLSLEEIRSILFEGATLQLSDKAKDNINKSYEFLKDFSSDKVIYGINNKSYKYEEFYAKEDKEQFVEYMKNGLSKLPCRVTGEMSELENIFLKIYANPVENLNTLKI